MAGSATAARANCSCRQDQTKLA